MKEVFRTPTKANAPRTLFGLDAIKVRAWMTKMNSTAATISHVGKTVTEVVSKPTVAGIVSAGITLASTYVTTVTKNEMAAPTGWKPFDVGVNLKAELVDFEDDDMIDLYSFGGQRILLRDKNNGHVEHDVDTFKYNLRSYLWDKYSHNMTVTGMAHDGITLRGSEDGPVFESPRAEALWNRIKGSLARGVHRAVMIDGRPGTGKSTMARMLAKRVGGNILRVPLSDAESLGTRYMNTVLELLKPDVLVIDDFDRLGHGAIRELDALERLRKQTRLFLVTTNNIAALDCAVVRPGRFDELFSVGSLGESYTAGVVGSALWDKLSPEQRTTIDEWPVVFLCELRIRFENIDDFKLEDELTDLANRVHINSRPTWATMRRIRDNGVESPAAVEDKDHYSDEDD